MPSNRTAHPPSKAPRACMEAVGLEGQVVPQQWLARTSARDVGPADRRRLDLVVYGATPLSEALLRRDARVASDTRGLAPAVCCHSRWRRHHCRRKAQARCLAHLLPRCSERRSSLAPCLAHSTRPSRTCCMTQPRPRPAFWARSSQVARRTGPCGHPKVARKKKILCPVSSRLPGGCNQLRFSIAEL